MLKLALANGAINGSSLDTEAERRSHSILSDWFALQAKQSKSAQDKRDAQIFEVPRPRSPNACKVPSLQWLRPKDANSFREAEPGLLKPRASRDVLPVHSRFEQPAQRHRNLRETTHAVRQRRLRKARPHPLRRIWTPPDESQEDDTHQSPESTTAAPAASTQTTEEENDEGSLKSGPFAEADGRDKRACPIMMLDPKGTVMLIVGREGAMRRLVVSSSLKRVSPEWQTVIGLSKRQKIVGRKIVRLADDDADMMLALMLIKHSRFAEVPRKLNFKQLLEMARICHRYNMNEIVDPFLELWVSPHRSKMLEAGREQWLFIAHQFGIETDYFALMKHLALHCRTNEQNELLAPGTDQVISGHFPKDCFVAIRYLRFKTLVKFLDAMYMLLDKMVQGNVCCAKNASQELVETGERTVCTFYNHGFLVRYLRTQGYWPIITRPENMQCSVQQLASVLMGVPNISTPSLRNDSVTSRSSQVESGLPSSAHAACDAGKILAHRIKLLLDRAEAPADPATLETLRRNALRSGVAKWPCLDGNMVSSAMTKADVEGAQEA